MVDNLRLVLFYVVPLSSIRFQTSFTNHVFAVDRACTELPTACFVFLVPRCMRYCGEFVDEMMQGVGELCWCDELGVIRKKGNVADF